LIDVVYPDEAFNAGLYQRLAAAVIEDLWKRGRPALVVGGTGLYIKALFGGLIDGAPPRSDLRTRFLDKAKKGEKNFLYRKLVDLDPQSAGRIHPNDVFRIVRALEVIDATGEPLSIQQKRHGFLNRPYKVLKIGLMADRDKLYRDIEKRVDKMLEMGLVDEVRSLFQKGYDLRHHPMRGLGYRHISQFLAGQWSLGYAVDLMKRDTRRYAKRQMTWFRSDNEIEWYEPYKAHEIKDKAKRFLLPYLP
jgi:tRNA dimethylallyltransferase